MWCVIWISFFPSPWTDDYETITANLYAEPVQTFLMDRMSELKSEAIVYTIEEYTTSVVHHHPQCSLVEVAHHRRGVVVVQEPIPQDELVLECKVRTRREEYKHTYILLHHLYLLCRGK